MVILSSNIDFGKIR